MFLKADMLIKNECVDFKLSGDIAKEFELDINLAQILTSRNIASVQDAFDFIYPKVENLSKLDGYVGLQEVADRMQIAINEAQTVVVYGDYDCDGICATSILYLFLKSKGVNVIPFLPSRYDNGYGLNTECLEELAENLLPDLLITVDCGISNIEEIDYCNEVLGIDVIVTDHHTPPSELPNCLIFNPKLSDASEVFIDLCGAGVALRLVEKLSSLAESKKYYDIATLATVADVVPLVADNRIIVYYGLKVINSGYRKGLDLLIKSNAKQQGEITSNDIAFRLAPKINSLGRLGDANKALGLFCESDRFLLDCLVDEINKTNEQRQQLTIDLVQFCNEKLQGYDFDKKPIIILYNPYWEEGVLGITASKIVGQYNRPTILLTKTKDGQIKGSGRSIDGINLYQLLDVGKQYLTKFGGHAMACGLSLCEENFQLFCDEIYAFALDSYNSDMYKAKYYYDIDIKDIEDTRSFCKQLAFLEPFGEGNTQPVFVYESNNNNFEQIGASSHLKQKTKNLEIVGWGLLKDIKLINCDCHKIFLCNLAGSNYNNVFTAQAKINKILIDKVGDSDDYESYIMQAKYDDNSIFSPKKICEKDIISLVDGKNFGVCFVAYDKQTYRQYINFFASNKIQLQENLMLFEQATPQNTIIYCPDFNDDLSNFSSIVFLDKPICLGFVDELNLYKNCKVFYLDNALALQNCKNYLVPYAQLGEIFVKIKSFLSQRAYQNAYLLFLDLSKQYDIDYNRYIVALNIFVELKIFVWKDGVLYFDATVVNKISNSKLYNCLKEA